MTEFELKFEIPSASLQGVNTALANCQLTRQRLQASYFDTRDGALARHGIVLRLRKEGKHWVQTAKGPTGDLLARLEHNFAVVQPSKGAVPAPDLSRHLGTPVGDAIAKALKLESSEHHPTLHFLYGTDVTRTTTQVATNGSVIEIALDQGRVFSGHNSQPICELELELKAGVPNDVVALAKQWRSAHGLWLSTLSKSIKGQRLGADALDVAATSATPPKFSRDESPHAMVTAVVKACLSQILPNMSELAASSASSSAHSDPPDHIHQLRVGIRRLRTALRELGDLAGAINPQWESALLEAFMALGALRDHSNLVDILQPQLAASGGPDMRRSAAGAKLKTGQQIVRDPDFQDAMLGLLAFVHAEPPALFAPISTLKKPLSPRLDKLYKQALRDGRKFSDLNETRQHGVRKRLKRLRYLVEFTAPLYAARKVHRMVKALKPVQDALGLYNDELMALHQLRELATADPKAWFGIGWLTARKPAHVKQCVKEIRKLADIKPFWRS